MVVGWGEAIKGEAEGEEGEERSAGSGVHQEGSHRGGVVVKLSGDRHHLLNATDRGEESPVRSTRVTPFTSSKCNIETFPPLHCL